jgi:hypothetical protein
MHKGGIRRTGSAKIPALLLKTTYLSDSRCHSVAHPTFRQALFFACPVAVDGATSNDATFRISIVHDRRTSTLKLGSNYLDRYRTTRSRWPPGYVRADAAVYISLSESARIQWNLENVFNTRYFMNADSNTNISPGSPRAFRIGMTTRF